MVTGVAAVLGLVAMGVTQGPNVYVEVQELDGHLVGRTQLPMPVRRLAWAPDGSALAVSLGGGSDGPSRVYVLDGHGLHPRPVTGLLPGPIGSIAVSRAAARSRSPARSVRGTRPPSSCTWSTSQAAGVAPYISHPALTNYDRQVQTAVRVVQWSPDGRRVLVGRMRFPGSSCDPHTRRTQADALVVDRTDGRRWVEAHDARSPRWSPDGSRLAYLTRGGRRLMVAQADGRDPHRLAPRRDVRQLAWLGRGGGLAVRGNSGIVVIDRAGQAHPSRPEDTRLAMLFGSTTSASGPRAVFVR